MSRQNHPSQIHSAELQKKKSASPTQLGLNLFVGPPEYSVKCKSEYITRVPHYLPKDKKELYGNQHHVKRFIFSVTQQ